MLGGRPIAAKAQPGLVIHICGSDHRTAQSMGLPDMGTGRLLGVVEPAGGDKIDDRLMLLNRLGAAIRSRHGCAAQQRQRQSQIAEGQSQVAIARRIAEARMEKAIGFRQLNWLFDQALVVFHHLVKQIYFGRSGVARRKARGNAFERIAHQIQLGNLVFADRGDHRTLVGKVRGQPLRD